MSNDTITIPFIKLVERCGPSVKIDIGEGISVSFPTSGIILDEEARTVTGPANFMQKKIAQAKRAEGQEISDLQIGYARAPSVDDLFDEQSEALRKAGCEYIFSDNVSASSPHRTSLRKAMSLLQEGDVLVVWRLDRLGRSSTVLVDVMHEIAEKKAHFRSLEDNIDTRNPYDGFAHVMNILSKMEKSLTAERDGVNYETNTKSQRQTPHWKQNKMKEAKELLEGGASRLKVSKYLDIPISTLYRWVPASTLDEKD
jgi:DNA invertase Pin-like site-specific DNA recombinase